MSVTDRDLTPSWILQETLNVHQNALDSYLATKGITTSPDASGPQRDNGLTLTVLGCGVMGTAVLGGILDSLGGKPEKAGAQKVTLPERLPSRFIAVVQSAASADRLRKELRQYALSSKVSICQGDHGKTIAAVAESDVVLLACKPHSVEPLLQAEGIRDALKGKLLVSICSGVTNDRLKSCLASAAIPDSAEQEQEESRRTITCIARAMPNIAAAIRESTTVIADLGPSMPASYSVLINWMFSRVGWIVHLPEANMDACTALCGSGPAFAAVFLESLAAGAIAVGVPRDEAYTMAAQTMRGTAGVLLVGREIHPALLRDKVTSPGGCTAAGLAVLEEGAMRGVVGKAVREAARVAKGQ
ncbi:pyrroline-5-carboxylate reductase [Teratosphaeria destructans]|uniref:Pyrroline-5-carboxylate reductase n=1 Tax=Teratosphaeria destructans TaxID=418781 RepID=A0A9W7SLY8_9PEZI|nr:pyrroline-5-carboxylate reductase [Teratosphaeria destructans]